MPCCFPLTVSIDNDDCDFVDKIISCPAKGHTPHLSNDVDYEFGDVYRSNWYNVSECISSPPEIVTVVLILCTPNKS